MISISGNLHFKIPWYFLVFHVRKNPVLMFCLTTSVDTIYHTNNPYKFNIISYSKGSWKKLKRLPFSKLYQLMLYLFCPSSVHPSLSLSLAGQAGTDCSNVSPTYWCDPRSYTLWTFQAVSRQFLLFLSFSVDSLTLSREE